MESNHVIFKSAEGVCVEFSLPVAKQFQALKNMIFDDDGHPIVVPPDFLPMPNIKERTLRTLVQFYEQQQSENEPFLSAMTPDCVIDLVIAADSFGAEVAFEEGAKCVAKKMVGKTPDEVRVILNLPPLPKAAPS